MVHVSFETQCWQKKQTLDTKFPQHHIGDRFGYTDTLSLVCGQLATMASPPCSPSTWSRCEKNCLLSSPGFEQIFFEWYEKYLRDDNPSNIAIHEALTHPNSWDPYFHQSYLTWIPDILFLFWTPQHVGIPEPSYSPQVHSQKNDSAL